MAPAIAFMHELDHGIRFNYDPGGFAKDTNSTDDAGPFDTMEEKRVETGLEARLLQDEGFPARTTHESSTCTVQGMFSRLLSLIREF